MTILFPENTGLADDGSFRTRMVERSKGHLGAEQLRHWQLWSFDRMLLTILFENGKWLSKPDEKRDAWVANVYGPGASVFHEFDQKTGQTREKVLGHDITDIHTIGKERLVWGDMHYTRLD